MTNRAMFEGLIYDEFENPVGVAYVGTEACYVIDDAGFRRHVSAEDIDRRVFETIKGQIEGNEDLISEQAAKMLGQDDLFSYAMIMNQIKQFDQHLENLLQTGIPEEGRAYMGMMGFKIIVNIHGKVIDVIQPSAEDGQE